MALHFNSDSGTDDYLSKNIAIFSGLTYPLTFSAWVRPDDKGAQHAVVSDSGNGTSKQIRLGASGNGKFLMGMRGASVASGVYYDNNNTTWFHILGSFEAAAAQKLYVSGAQDGSSTTGSNISDFSDSDYFYIGTGVSSGTDIASKTWEGGLAEVAAYAAELTAGEIAALAAGYSPLFIRPDALVGYWPLGGISYPTDYADFLGSNNLAATGTPAIADHPPIMYPTSPIIFPAAAETADTLAAIQYYYR